MTKFDVGLTAGICLLAAILAFRAVRRVPPRKMPDLTLSTVIERFRDELDLATAHAAKNGRDPLFRLSSVELEVNVLVRESETASGGVKLEPVTAEQSEQYSTERIQKVKLHLEPFSTRHVSIPPKNGG